MDTDLDEGSRQAGTGEISIPVLHDLVERDVIVERPGLTARAQPILLAAEASAGKLWNDLPDLLPAPRDDVDRPAQRVPPEEHGWPTDHLHPLGVLKRNQVEVDLLDGRLVDPDPVQKHAEPLGKASDGRNRESPQREIRLKWVALLVLKCHARESLESVRQDRRADRLDLGIRQDLDAARHP